MPRLGLVFRSHRPLVPHVVAAVLVSAAFAPLVGQEGTDSVALREPGGRVSLLEDDPLTLAVWAERVWISILDRDGAVHGRLAREGVFQRFHPRMDREYLLDVRTGLFTPAEDGRWLRTGSRLRIAGASVSHPHILNVIDWRQEVPVAGGVDVVARFHRERSFTARRDYPRVGVRWGNVLGSAWTAGAHLGVHFSKPAADVELTLARTWGGRREREVETVGQGAAAVARWRLELGVAALDVFSDLVFQGLGVDDEDVGRWIAGQACSCPGSRPPTVAS